MTTSLSQAVDHHLTQHQEAGLLTRSRPRRYSPQHYRRQRRLTEAVEALVAVLLDYDAPTESSSVPFHLRSGLNFGLEEEASQWLAEGRRGELRVSDLGDWLTTEQLILRRAREVYCTQGQPDSALKSGLYRRAFNPLSGQRPRGQKGSEDG